MVTYFLRKSSVVRRWTAAGLLALAMAAPVGAAAQTTFGQIVVFGDSLSDPGNAFVLTGALSTPPYDTLDPLLIPESPYAKGGHHFSNGATWVEQFARPLGLAGNARPAFQGAADSKAANYAVGGARAHQDGIHVNLPAQVTAFLTAVNGQAPTDGLYIIEIGGNDVRDALTALASGGDPGAIISAALASIGNNIGALYASGARKFLVWNTPDLRPTPAIRALDSISPGAGQAAESLGQAFNAGLDAVLGNLSQLPGIEIKLFDAFQTVNALVADPGAYGLDVVNAACVMPDIPPFECQTPDEYLFWDGIHPTGAVHGILAQETASLLAH
jgi:phospholipase/lecithinase/hemolysin